MRLIYVIASLTFILACDSNQNNNFVNYHLQINEAEKLIAQKSYESALTVYKEVFRRYPQSFYKDLHNACLCALKQKEFQTAREIAEELVLHGYEMQDFRDPAFSSLKEDAKECAVFESNYSRLRANYLKNQNLRLRKFYWELYKEDQAATSTFEVSLQDSVFYENALKLVRAFDSHGFPSIGVNKDTMNFKIYVFFRHYCGLVNRVKVDPDMRLTPLYGKMNFDEIGMDSILLRALHNGRISPQAYADAVSYWDPSNPYGDVAIKLDFEKEKASLYLNLKPEDIEEVNKRRRDIGLYPISPASEQVLASTWLSKYPFAEIKEAYINCDTCETILDYMNLSERIVNRVQENFSNGYSDSFILPDINNIKDFWVFGDTPYIKNADVIPKF